MLDRLTSEPGQTFSWDGNGNRLADAAGSYSYLNASNRMTAGPAGAIVLDGAGNTTTIGNRSFVYSEAGKLIQASVNGATVGTYVFRADALRAAKSTTAGTVLFHWGLDGTLLEESTGGGMPTRSYAWAEGAPISQWTGAGPVAPIYLHTDHLMTARVASSSVGSVVWRWDGSAFGGGAPTGSSVVNLRLPGQYFDEETGLCQNWMRSYDPMSGRYLESDPIGFGGGINTFSYVSGNPLMYMDPYGLFGWADMPTLPQGLVDFSAGFGDDISFGLTRGLRNVLNIGGANVCSGAYTAGTASGVAWGLGWGGATIGRHTLNVAFDKFFVDSRRYDTVQKIWSRSVGGYKGKYQLHHWFTPQSAGGTSAGWNLVALTPEFNNAMSDGGLLFSLFKGAMIGGYLGAASSVPMAAFSNTNSECTCDK